jgi:hypothetical protein
MASFLIFYLLVSEFLLPDRCRASRDPSFCSAGRVQELPLTGIYWAEMAARFALKQRPDAAFEALYRGHVHEVYRYTLAVLGNPADAEDVTQTTFLNAYRARRVQKLSSAPGRLAGGRGAEVACRARGGYSRRFEPGRFSRRP